MDITLRPIGWVHNDVKEPRHEGWESVVSEIAIDEELAPALEGIEGFSHLYIIFWLDRLDPDLRRMLQVHPRDRQDLPLVGSFAARTQYRPNPLALTVARLQERRGNTLIVLGLDALDGTPVVDIKPYAPDLDVFPEARIPDWLRKLWETGHRH